MTGADGELGRADVDGTIRTAVLGFGYWGPNLVRNLAALGGCEVAAICDPRPERLVAAGERYPGTRLASDPRDVLSDATIDAVAIATPVATHFPLALAALRAGKHVFVEKPLAGSSDEARCLLEEAAARELVLMAGHVFLYTGAVRKIREIVDSASFGDFYYYDSVRVNYGIFQHDVNVLWDLAVHDLSILDYLVAERPCAISATGAGHLPGGPENTAYLTAFFDSKLIAHVSVNWLAPVKVRTALVGGSGSTIVYDDLEPVEKVKVYGNGASQTQATWTPELDGTEALQIEVADFVGSIVSGRSPVVDGLAGLRVVQMLEAATRSMRDRGRPVELVFDD